MFSTVGWRGPVGGHGECSVMALSAPVLVLYINRVRKRRKWIHGTKIACVFVSSWCAISAGLRRLGGLPAVSTARCSLSLFYGSGG